MGCSTTREKIESKMLKLKLRRVEIKQERNKQIKELEKITGKHVNRQEIEDYVDELITFDNQNNHSENFEKDKKSENETKKSNNSNKKRKKNMKKKMNIIIIIVVKVIQRVILIVMKEKKRKKNK